MGRFRSDPAPVALQWVLRGLVVACFVGGLVLSAGCGSAAAQRVGAVADRGFAVVVIEGPPGEALLWVDDAPAGTWARRSGAFELAPGSRRLRIEAPGYLDYRTELRVAAGEVYDLQVELWPCFQGVDAGCEGTGSP